MSKPVVLIGGGGHAKVLLEILLLRKVKIFGFTDIDGGKKLSFGKTNIKYLGKDEAVKQFSPKDYDLVNGLGSVGVESVKNRRQLIFEEFHGLGFKFLNLIHPTSTISEDVKEAIHSKEGAQIMAGANIRPGSKVGDNTIINTEASVDHECAIGSHVHIAPGAILSGGVFVGDGAHIGTGAIIIQGKRVGERGFVHAGDLVSYDVPQNGRSVGRHPGMSSERVEQ